MQKFDGYFETRQTPIIMLQLTDSESTQLVAKSSVATISYSVVQVHAGGVDSPVAGHTSGTISLSCYYSTAQQSAIWTRDTIGFNFRWTPDTVTNPIFQAPGVYRVSITFTFAGRNPHTVHLLYLVS